MAIFYIDYENVKSKGVDGIESLKKGDKVFLFYSDQADSIKFETLLRLQSSKAEVTFLRADNGTRNSLDFQLIAHLFNNIRPKTDTYIVTNDNGFDAAVKMGRRLGYQLLHRISSLSVYVDKVTKSAPAARPVSSAEDRKKLPLTKALLQSVPDQEKAGPNADIKEAVKEAERNPQSQQESSLPVQEKPEIKPEAAAPKDSEEQPQERAEADTQSVQPQTAPVQETQAPEVQEQVPESVKEQVKEQATEQLNEQAESPAPSEHHRSRGRSRSRNRQTAGQARKADHSESGRDKEEPSKGKPDEGKQTVTAAGTKTESKAENKAENKPESKTESKPESKEEIKTEVKAEAGKEAKADAKDEDKGTAKAEDKGTAKAEDKGTAKAEDKPRRSRRPYRRRKPSPSQTPKMPEGQEGVPVQTAAPAAQTLPAATP